MPAKSSSAEPMEAAEISKPSLTSKRKSLGSSKNMALDRITPPVRPETTLSRAI